MKKSVLFVSLILFMYASHAQFDSAGIIQQHTTLRNNMSSYTNQPFSVLYNALTIKPKSISGFSPYYNKNVEDAHKFYYETDDSLFHRDIYIYIEWQTPIPLSETRQYKPRFYGPLTPQEYSIYANKIIKKVQFFPDPSIDGNGTYMKAKPQVKKVPVKKVK